MIKATNIRKKFGDLEVLKGVDIEIKESEIVSIVGSSGAGKTTLLQILGTLSLPDQGEIIFDGKDLNKLKNKDLAKFRNQNIGFVFQFHQLLPEFTALENVCMPALIAGKSMKEAKNLAIELLQKLNIDNRKDHKPSELSGGEQQRVATARALINNPKVIFADEPSGNLDSKNANELHQLFFNLRDEFKQTFVIITHNQLLANLCDRKIVMEDGILTN